MPRYSLEGPGALSLRVVANATGKDVDHFVEVDTDHGWGRDEHGRLQALRCHVIDERDGSRNPHPADLLAKDSARRAFRLSVLSGTVTK